MQKIILKKLSLQKQEANFLENLSWITGMTARKYYLFIFCLSAGFTRVDTSQTSPFKNDEKIIRLRQIMLFH